MKITLKTFLYGCAASGVVNSLTTWQIISADNIITRAEWISLAFAFVGGVALYLTNHKDEWNGIDRRDTAPKP